MLSDFHVHTKYSDGRDDPESVVLYALDKGCDKLGFSDHSYTFFDQSYCMKSRDIPKYRKEINDLKEKYKDKIAIFLGIEQDFYSKKSPKNYDYAIGSVHYLRVGGKYYEIDGNKETFVKTVQDAFGGDYISACEKYFDTIRKFAGRDRISIIGHFDVVSKFNGDGSLFDESDPRYVKAYKKAAKALVKAGKIFEINTSGYRKKRRSDVYPAKPIRDYIKSLGGKFILSSDSHKKEDLFFAFDEFIKES